MTLRDFLAQLLGLVAPLVLSVVGGAVAVLTPWLRRWIASKRLQSLVEIALNMTALAVAAAYQTVVLGLKDPAQPGAWDAGTAQKVRSNVLATVRKLIPRELRALDRGGVDVDRLLEEALEKSVLELKDRIALNQPITSFPPPPGVPTLPLGARPPSLPPLDEASVEASKESER